MSEEHDLSDVEAAKISTGSSGLDEILCEGFDPERMYLYEGRPGSGKTTLALQFLLDGGRFMQNPP
jgi:circadian clock protein KaiC